MKFVCSPSLLGIFILIGIAGCKGPGSESQMSNYESNIAPVFTAYDGKVNLLGHSLPIEKMAISADEQYLYTISTDRSTKVWDIKTGEVIRTLFYERWWTEGTTTLCPMPNNNIILQHGSHLEIWSPLLEHRLDTLYDTKTNLELNIRKLRVTKDGKKLITLFNRGLSVIDLASKKTLFEYYTDNDQRPVSLFGSQLIGDASLYVLLKDKVMVLDLNTFTYSMTKMNEPTYTELPDEASFSGDGRYLVFFSMKDTHSNDYSSRGYVYDLIDKKRTQLGTHGALAVVSDFAGDHRTFFTASGDGLKKWSIDASGNASVAVLDGRLKYGRAIALSNTMVVACSPDYWTNDIHFYNILSNSLLKEITRMPASARTFMWSADGESLTGNDDGFWLNLKTGQSFTPKEKTTNINEILKDRNYIAVNYSKADPAGNIKYYLQILEENGPDLRIRFDLNSAEKEVKAMDLNSGAKLLALQYYDSVKIYDLEKRIVIDSMPIPYAGVIRLSHQGNLLVIKNKVYNLSTHQWGPELTMDDTDYYPITGITFSEDDKLLAVSIPNMKYFIYDVPQEKLIRMVETSVEAGIVGAETYHVNIAFSPDNRFFAAGEPNKKVKVWEIGSGNIVALQNGNYTDTHYLPEQFADGKYRIVKYQDGFYFEQDGHK